jgi:hypothetical protein
MFTGNEEDSVIDERFRIPSAQIGARIPSAQIGLNGIYKLGPSDLNYSYRIENKLSTEYTNV